MHDLLNQIRVGNNNDLYYLTLFAILSLPDICGSLSSVNGEATKGNYIAWFDKYVAPKYKGNLSGEICYFYRCSLLHQGSSQHPKSVYSRIFFLEPKTTSNIFHNNIFGDALNIDIRIFIEDIITGVETWLAENENTPLFIKNYAKYVTRYPNGLPPYVVGTPVIS